MAEAYAKIATLLCRQVPRQRPEIFSQSAMRLFWTGLTAFNRAKRAGVASAHLDALASAMRTMILQGPAELRRIPSAHLVQLLGLPWASRLRQIITSQRWFEATGA